MTPLNKFFGSTILSLFLMLSLLLVPVSSMWSNVRVMVLEWAINAGLLGVVFGDMFEGLGFLMENLWF